MVSLEQIKLLESKVTQTIDYVKKVTEENRRLSEELVSGRKRIDELEALIARFKQDQSRIEEGILSALERLNQFEDALESKLSTESKLSPESKPAVEGKLSVEGKPAAESRAPAASGQPVKAAAAKTEQETREVKKVPQPLSAAEASPPEPGEDEDSETNHGELDIF